MQTTFGVMWNFRRGEPIDPLTPHQARDHDKVGTQYAVGIGDPADLDVVLEVDWENNHFGVWFFDEHGRRSVKYTFTVVDDDRMFLGQMTNWQYPDTNSRGLNEADVIEVLFFTQDGTVRRERRDDRTGESIITDVAGVDVDSHWESVPAFGEWASAARYHRNSPPGQNGNI